MKNNKKISIRPIEREDPDLRLLARAIIELVMDEQQAERETQDATEAAGKIRAMTKTEPTVGTTPSSTDVATNKNKTTSTAKSGTDDVEDGRRAA